MFKYWQNPHHFDAQKRYVPEDAEHPVAAMEDGLDDLHWTQLRKLVQGNDGEYSNKDDAIEWLREKGIGKDDLSESMRPAS
jgi:hypothetical protein